MSTKMYLTFRSCVLAAGLCLLLPAGCNSAKDAADSGGEVNDEAKQQIKDALPAAAGMPYREFEILATSASAPRFEAENQPLSLVFLAFRIDPLDEDPKKLRAEFQMLDDMPKPSEFAEAMVVSKSKGYASVIQPEYIDEFTCEGKDGTATGTVTFTMKNVLRATVHYVAKYLDGQWRIVEFSLPAHQTVTKLDSGTGNWKGSGPAVSTVLDARLPDVAGLPPRDYSASRLVVYIAPEFGRDREISAAIGSSKTPVAKIGPLLRAELDTLTKQLKTPASRIACVIHADHAAPTGVVQEVMQRAMEEGLETFRLVARIEPDQFDDADFDYWRTGEIELTIPIGVAGEEIEEMIEVEEIEPIEIESIDVTPLDIESIEVRPSPLEQIESSNRLEIDDVDSCEVGDFLPPVRVRAMSDARGDLVNVRLNEMQFGQGLDKLRHRLNELVQSVESDETIDVTLELDADYELRYEHFMDVLSICAGYLDQDGRWVPLVKNIRLSPPRHPAGQ